MPAKKSQSDFAGAMGSKFNNLIKKHAGDETTYGNEPMPGGILNGVAVLESIGFGKVREGKENAGKPYLTAQGVAEKPDTFTTKDGAIKIPGRRTSVFISLWAQKGEDWETTEDEQWSRAMNTIRQMGGDTSSVETVQDLVDICKGLEEEENPIRFKFTTDGGGEYMDRKSKKVKQKRINHYWHGKVDDDYIPEDTSTVDNSSNNGEVFDETSSDLVSLLEAAKGPKNEARTKAQNRIKELAIEAGVSEEEFGKAKDFDAVVKLMEKKGSKKKPKTPKPVEEPEEENEEEESEEVDTPDTEEEEEEVVEDEGVVEDEPTPPKVGDLFRYTRLDSKGNPLKVKGTDKDAKPVEVEVMKVNTAKKVVTLRMPQTQKMVLGKDEKDLWVSWDKLVPIPD